VTNNDILRRTRFIFDYNEPKMVEIFSLGNLTVTQRQMTGWLKPPQDRTQLELSDIELGHFLDGLIVERRGPSDKPTPPPEEMLSNNTIFRKIKIAMAYQSDEILELLVLAGNEISKHELSAFFRKPDHKHYRVCKDQILRKFMHGMQLKYRKDT